MDFVLTTFILSSYFVSMFASEVFVNFLTGSNKVIKCNSSYAPPWSKTGSEGEYQIIGVGGKKHPQLKEARFTFTNEGNVYSLRISDVRLSDAGKFVCGSDNPNTYVVTVLR